MKAILRREYGAPYVLDYEDVAKPVPADNEVLIRVRATSVNPYDWHFMRGEPSVVRLVSGFRKPKDHRLGVDMAGEVEAVGKNVTQFAPGDEVFGPVRGAYAEYACGTPKQLAAKPATVTFEQAAAVPVAALTALQALRRSGRLQAGQRVLINGAAGGVGTFAVQIAKSFGAAVHGVCSSGNVEMVRSIGADRVFDYTREDFTQSGERYDVIVDCILNHPLSAYRRVLHRQGRYVIVGGRSLRSAFGALLRSPFISQSVVLCMARSRHEDLIFMRDLMAAGKVTPVIDRRYELSELPAAIAYAEEGHARGKVVITVKVNEGEES